MNTTLLIIVLIIGVVLLAGVFAWQYFGAKKARPADA